MKSSRQSRYNCPLCGPGLSNCRCGGQGQYLPVRKAMEAKEREEAIDHPQHYGGKNNPYEAIKVIEAWDLGFCLGNVVKYISRAGKKPKSTMLEDLKKAQWYLNREIQRIEHGDEKAPE